MKKTKKEKMQKIVKQKSLFEFDKAKNLILHSIKVFANDSLRDDKVLITKNELAKIAKLKKNDVASLKAMLYKYTRQDALKIDSESQRLQLCNHARARQHCFNQVASALKRDDLIVNYSKKEK